LPFWKTKAMQVIMAKHIMTTAYAIGKNL